MKWHSWEDLHRELQDSEWFAHVGEPLKHTDPSLCAIESWSLAREWAGAEISWWCVNEASNVLRLHLSNNHRLEYRKWNEHIKSFAPQRDELVEQVVSPLVPPIFRVKVTDWIRSHLTSAYLECVYAPMADVHLVCDQVEWYLQGHFPCGWTVIDEESFPKKAVTLVF